MQKTYITPKMKEPELVIQPAGKKDAQGNKISRKTVQFMPNPTGCGQFTTSDANIQAFLDSHEYMSSGQMVVLKGPAPETAPAPEAPETKTRQGVQTSEPDEAPIAPEVKKGPGRPARVK